MTIDDDGILDGGLRSLGTGTPFTVDWRDYDARLAQRLFERERGVSQTMRRRGIMCAAFGACAGAALTAAALYVFVLVPLHYTDSPALSRTLPAPVQSVQSASAPTHVLRGIGTATFSKESAHSQPAPFQTDIVHADGSIAQIRFEGFSTAAKPGWIAAHSNEH